MNYRYEMAKHAYKTVQYYRELAEENPQIIKWIENGEWEKIKLF